MFGINKRQAEIMYKLGVMSHKMIDIESRLVSMNSKLMECDNCNHDIKRKLDKFEENFNRFELMFNEFKGCISMARASLPTKCKPKKKPKKEA